MSQAHPAHPRKIVVIGSSCSGKTTLARELAQKLTLAHIELDALFWEPGWREAEISVFLSRARQALEQTPAWVVDGNYINHVRDVIWPQAELIIWLDPPLTTILYRLFSRSLRRSFAKEMLWNGCRETMGHSIFSKNSLLVYILRTRRAMRGKYADLLKNPPDSKIQIQRFRTGQGVSGFLSGLAQ